MIDRILLLVTAAFLGAGGQILFKKASSYITFKYTNPFGFLIDFIKFAFTTPALFFAFTCYGFSVILWVYVLSKTELTFVYPFTVLTYVLVIIGGYLFFQENISLNKLVGSIVAITGIIIIAVE